MVPNQLGQHGGGDGDCDRPATAVVQSQVVHHRGGDIDPPFAHDADTPEHQSPERGGADGEVGGLESHVAQLEIPQARALRGYEVADVAPHQIGGADPQDAQGAESSGRG